jgi:hypothetical protein
MAVFGVGKIIIGGKLLKQSGGKIAQGNHFFYIDNCTMLPASMPNPIIMAHYPLRSVEQAMTKVIVGWINTLCVPGRTSGAAKNPTHWEQMYNYIKKNGALNINDLRYFTKKYIKPGDQSVDEEHYPLAEGSIPSEITLRYTDYNKSRINFMEVILSHFEYVLGVLMK